MDSCSRHVALAVCAAVSLALLPLAVPTSAFAQTDAGRIHFQAGASDYESGDYQHALEEFQRAYELSQRPQLFYNIALAYQQLGDLEHAVEYLGRFLNEVEDIANRENLERRLANFQERLVAQQANRTGSDANPDTGAGTGTGAGTDVGAGTDAGAGTDIGAGTEPGGPSSGGANVPAIASFIGGGVGLALAVSFGAIALSEQHDCDDRLDGADPCTKSDGDTMDTFALLSDVGTGLAVVGVGLGLIFLLTADDEEDDPNQARVHVAPFASPNSAGIATQGRF